MVILQNDNDLEGDSVKVKYGRIKIQAFSRLNLLKRLIAFALRCKTQ
jgi:hypothetical protein